MTQKKSAAVPAIIISVLLVVCIGFSAVNMLFTMQTKKAVLEYTGKTEDVAREDGVVIDYDYEIKSTRKISDAYISGDSSSLSDADKETLEMAGKVLDKIIKKEMTDFEKEKAVYVWLTSKLTASTSVLDVISSGSDDCFEPHDVLKYHNAVCVGYATTFRLFMQMLGIECMVVHSSDLIHSWNLVKLDDGWYHVDCYFDSGEASFSNFNLNDEICENTHAYQWNRDFFPEANGQKHIYIFSVSKQLKNIYKVPEWLMKAIKDKETVISCTFSEKLTDENAAAAQYMVNQLAERVCNDELSVTTSWMTNPDKEYVLCFYITYYDEDVDVDVDEKTMEKIDGLIDKMLEKYGFDSEPDYDFGGDEYGVVTNVYYEGARG